ncbi:hypothetical protein BU23DRAFT_602351 [Bimuria novae-zelandiae CBS 107.79]|uniref:RING-type domain-containing protein n=1 Tax=Bimuria novae-zelandiae CBS 107.79 TaxID=1447943 RepID=A0A6A5UTZ1_9PLEO|nr:hypothetical protein BU23DRAFT_602351 [Bimuria novae-zelandiae CBS 107.79]
MESELPFGYARREKRSAAQMDLDGSASPTWSPFDRFSVSRETSAPRTAFRPAPTNEMPAARPQRFQGDGFDYRRPVVSSNNVIDLTDEDAGPSSAANQPHRSRGRPARPPRFGREIIDVEEEDSGTAEPPDSPEIQFVSSRRIEPTQRTLRQVMDDEEEDEVEFLRANPLPESERRPHTRIADLLEDPAFRRRAPHLRGYLEQEEEAETRRVRNHQIARMERMFAEARSRRTPRPLSAGPQPVVRIGAGRRNGPAHIHVGFIAPTLNFGAVGFHLGFDDEPDAAPAPPPTYDAPEAAPKGFTRSPQEEDVLVCPNCNDELCVGGSDQKRQVWLVKGCGHVYCGECMLNRHIKKTSKGKEKATPHTKPFKECVVDGCTKKVSSKSAVIQVFL